MDFFERAHIPRKSSPKMQNKTEDALKAQFRQMLQAFKKGDNEGIRTSSEIKPKFNDTILSAKNYNSSFNKSMEENSDYSNASDDEIIEEAGNIDRPDCSNASFDESSNTLDSNATDSVQTSNDNDVSDCNTEDSIPADLLISKSPSTISGESDLSHSGSAGDLEYDEFDADGILASKIIEKLGRKLGKISEEELSEVEKLESDTAEVSSISNSYNSRELSDSPEISFDEDITKSQSPKQPKFYQQELKKPSSLTKIKKPKIKLVPKSLQKNIKKSKSRATDSPLFISVSAEESGISLDTQLGELVGEYVHPTIRNISSDKVNIVNTATFTNMFPSNLLSLKDIQRNSISLDESSENQKHSKSKLKKQPSYVLRNINSSEESSSLIEISDSELDILHPKVSSAKTFSNIPNSYESHRELEEISASSNHDEDIDSLIPEVGDDLAMEAINLDADSQELSQDNIDMYDLNRTEMEDSTMEEPTDTIVHHRQIKLYEGNNQFVLVMRHPSEFYMHGRVRITNINGSPEILGYKMKYDAIDVYAPYSHFAQCLKTTETMQPINPDLQRELTNAGLSTSDTGNIMLNIEEYTSVIVLKKLNSRTLDFVSSTFTPTSLFTRRAENMPLFFRKAAECTGCALYLQPPKKIFQEKKIWDEVYSSVICRRESSRGVICGGKSTGKSTFLRHYVNSFLSDGPILVLDLDPGQAEFTVPGSLSATVVDRPLVGPGFTHLRKPEISLNIGMINTMDNAKRYLSAVSELITHCSMDSALSELPWIVNTMGMCNHMGLKFITYIILLVQPTFLFQIDSKTPKKKFKFELDPVTVTQLYTKNANCYLFRDIKNPYCLRYSFIIARPEEASESAGFGTKLVPRDERYLNILAYFGQMLDTFRATSLLNITPYEVHIKDLHIALNVKIPEDTITKVLNGKIVALCQQNQYDSAVFTLEDKALLCHGHGLVRNIDTERGILYILTPIPIRELSFVNTLLYSDWMPELRGLEKDPLEIGTTIPYRNASLDVYQRKLMFPPRRRFNPLQLLKISRNT